MGVFKLFEGDDYIKKLRLGLKNISLFLGEKLLYQIPISGATTTCNPATYNGSKQIAQNIIVKLSGQTLTNNVDYIVTNNDGGVNAGTYSYTISGMNYFDTIANGSFTINPKAVTNPTITLEPTSYTYNGSQCKPTPTVKDGSTIIPSTEYTVTYSNNINVGTATCTITNKSGSNYTVSGSKTFTINKAAGSVTTKPTAKDLTYNNLSQPLVNAGVGTGTMLYKLDSGNWDTSIPTGKDVNNYTVYYKASASTNYNESASGSVTVNIAKVTPTVTAPTAKSLTYNGNPQALVNSGSTNYGTLQYSIDNSTWSTSIPNEVNAGNYTVYYRVVGNANIYDVDAKSVEANIAKANPTYTAPTKKTGLVYNGNAQSLLNGGSTSHGTIQYSSDGSSWGATIPTGTNASSTYSAYWKLNGDSNHNSVGSTKISDITISKVTPTVTAPTPKTLTFNNANQTLANAGSTNYGTIQYCLNSSGGTYSTTVPSASAANVTYKVWYKVVGDSNVNDVAAKSIDCMIAEKRVTSPTITLSPSSYTYSGSQCKPTPTVKDGSTVIPSSEYNVGYSNNINAGTATVTISDKDAGNYYISGTTTFSISKVTPTVTAPTAKSLTYNGNPQALVNAGSTNFGSLQYCTTSGGTYSTTIPTQTNAGSYEVWYKVVGDSNVNSTNPTKVSCSIAKASGTATVAGTSNTYNGSAKNLVTVSNNTGTMHYKVDSGGWSTTLPQATNAGSWTIYWYMDASTNYNGIDSASTRYVSSSIAKASGSVTTKPTAKTLTYNGSAQALVNAGSGTGTMMYKLDSGSWGTSIPSATNATSYTVYYKASASTNYNESASGSVSCSIAKVTPTVTAPTAKSLTYNGSAQQLANAGSTNFGTLKYCLTSGGTYSTSVPSGTNATSYAVYYRVDGDSNVNSVSAKSISCSIAKADTTYTAPTKNNRTYDTTSKALLNAGAVTGGTIYYSSDNTNWSTTIPSQTNAGTYTTYWKITGDSNHKDKASASIETTISAKSVSSPTITLSQSTYTYSNSECKPTPTVKDGSVTIASSEYTVSYSNNINVGTATCTISDKSGGNYTVSGSKTFTINCYTATAPTNKNPNWTGSAQAYANAGSTSYGTMVYCNTSGGTFTTSLPTATNAGSYELWWKVTGNTNVCNTTAAKVSCSIAKVAMSYTAPKAATYTYNGSARQIVSGQSAAGGSIYYATSSAGASSSTTVPTQTNAGTYSTYWKAIPDSNHSGGTSSWAQITGCLINKANGSVTINGVSLTYNATSRNLATVSSNTGTMHYSTNGTSWSTSIPTSTNVGSWTIYWYMDESSNYTGIASASTRYVSSSIGKANQSAPTATGATVTYHNTATATAGGGGGVGSIEWYNNVYTRTATGTTTGVTARWSGNSNYNASPYSNSVNLVVNKATDQSVSVTLTNRTYNGSGQVVASATSHGCTYYLGFGSSSTSAPTSWGSANSSISQTNAGTYYVWYKGTADSNHSADIGATYKGSVTIGKADQSAPTAAGSTTTYPTTATASASGGGGVGSLTWESAQSQTSVGSHSTRARWSGNDNYNASPWSNSVTVQMNKAGGSVTTAPVNNNYTYNGTARAVASAGSGTGTMYYRLGSSGSFSTTMPTMTDAGSNTLYYYAAESTNYTQSSTGSITVSVQKASQSAPTASVTTATYPGTSTASASGGGGVGTLTWTNGSTRTAIGTATTAAYWSGSSNYKASSNSNSVTLSVSKYTPTVTLSATNRAYNGNALYATASVGTPSGGKTMKGTIYYGTSSGAQTYSVTYGGSGSVNLSSVSVTNVGSATVYAYFVPDSTCNDVYNNSGNVSKTFSVSKANQSAPTATGATTTYHNTATATAGGGGGVGTLTWTNGNTRSATGTTTTAAYWSGNGNYNASPNSNSVNLVVNKATDQSVSVTLTNRTYNGNGQVVASASSHGCTYYLGFGGSSTSAPSSWGSANSSISQTNAGTYYVWYKGTADGNHSSDIGATYKGSVTIGKADQSAPTAAGATTTYPTGATASASGGGGVGTLTWTNGSSRSSCGSQTTKAYWAGNSNYNASPYSNEVTITVNKGACPSYTAPSAKSGLIYNGSSQTLYNAGSSSNGTFSYSNGSRTAAGSQAVSWSFTPTDSCRNGDSGSFTGTIAQKAISIPTPTGVSRAYNGSAAAATFGSATGAGITKYRYSTNGSSWTETTSNPSQTNAGTLYTQAYYSANDSNYSGAGWSSSATISISKADQSAPGATGATTTYPTTATASASGGGGVGSIEWESAQSQTSVGSHTTRARWSGNSNYNASPWSSSVTVQMNKAAGSVSKAPTNSGAVYGSGNYVCTEGSGTGTMYYRLETTSSYSTTRPTTSGLGATTYTLFYYAAESTNYTQSSTGNIVISVQKASQSAPTATGSTVCYGNTATASASGGGGVGTLTWTYGSTRTAIGTTTTAAYWSGNGNYNASSNSSSVNLTVENKWCSGTTWQTSLTWP